MKTYKIYTTNQLNYYIELALDNGLEYTINDITGDITIEDKKC